MFSCLKSENEGAIGGKTSFFGKIWQSLKRKISPKARRERKTLKKLMAEVEKEKERERREIQAVERIVEDIHFMLDEVDFFFIQH